MTICPVCETKQSRSAHTAQIKLTIDGKTIYEPYNYYR